MRSCSLTAIRPGPAAGLAILVVTLAVGPAASAQGLLGPRREADVVAAATETLGGVSETLLPQIPESLLADAHGVAVVPGMIKVGFVGGVQRGRGVVLLRDDQGRWELPRFLTVTGGSIGWQAGAQSIDLLLVFKTRRSIEGLLDGQFKLGADAAVAAGPLGRNAGAATDVLLQAEIFSYSRSRGLFAGVAVDGSVLQIDTRASQAYYGAADPAQAAHVPDASVALVELVAALTAAASAGGPVGAPVAGGELPSAEALGRDLAASAVRLHELLDAPWRRYLALPRELFDGAAPSATALDEALARYDNVAADPRYADLARRDEFRATHRLLFEYRRALVEREAALDLPPPPAIEFRRPPGR
jgi:lipid-binding SYLF domain-containing protein